MKISTLTVCYNSEKTIRHTLDSFYMQDYIDKEIIIIDGASTDNSVMIAKSYPQDQMLILSEPDKGMYDALNKALALYTGDAFGVLNSDDCYHDARALSQIVYSLRKSDAVHGHLNFVRDHDYKKCIRKWRGVERPAKGFRTGWMPAHPTFYVKRHIAEMVGLFDLNYKTSSDYDWMLRACSLPNFTLDLVDCVLIDMMQGGRSTGSIRSHIHHNYEALRVRQKHLDVKGLDLALFAKPLSKVAQFVNLGK